MSTKEIADNIVEHLIDTLSGRPPGSLPTVRSIFLCGSYVRGDWVDYSSDLDINVLYSDFPGDGEQRSDDLKVVKGYVADLNVSEGFPSQIPGGIDWGILPDIPKSTEDVSKPTPYVYFSAFYFDFRRNIRIIWGEDFVEHLPAGPPPRDLCIAMVESFAERISMLGESVDDRRRAAFAAYKSALLLQIHFGIPSIDKREVLRLFGRNVPDCAAKRTGRKIIGGYLNAKYPDSPASYESVGYYMEYLSEVLDCMRDEELGKDIKKETAI